MKAFLLIGILLSFHAVLAQETFESGSVITPTGDTLQGYIDYRNWYQNPENIRFKPFPEAPEQTFTLQDIQGFRVHDETYTKATVWLNTSRDQLQQLSTSPTPQLEKRTVFLRTLVEGFKSLYYLKDTKDRTHFYIKRDGSYELLTYYRYKVSSEQAAQIAVLETYKEQLKSYFSDCAAVQKKVSFAAYNQISLQKLVENYWRECGHTAEVRTTTRERINVQVGLVGGLTYTTLKFSGPSSLPDFSSSYGPAGGFSLKLGLPRTRQRLAIHNELLYTSYHSTGHTEEYIHPDRYSFTDFTLAYGCIKLTNLIRYQLPWQRIQFFAHAGISNGWVISETNTRRKVATLYSDKDRVTLEKVLEGTRKHEQGLIVGIGAQLRKLSAEIRYETSNGMSDYSALKSAVKRAYVLVGFSF